MKRKTICVFGSTTKEGKELCLKYARIGYDIGVCYQTERSEAEHLEELILGMGSRVELFSFDLEQETAIPRVLFKFADFYGHIDLVANCMGELIQEKIYSSLLQLFSLSEDLVARTVCEDIGNAQLFTCPAVLTQQPKPDKHLFEELKSECRPRLHTIFDVTEYGAKGDNFTDDTAAIQKAIDEAGECEGTVFFPAGNYRVGQLILHPNIALKAEPVWSYRTVTGAVLSLNDYNAKCLLDVTDAHGVHIFGLCLDGKNKGENIHGIAVLRDTPSKQEDMFQIEKCRIGCFTGDGVHFDRVWAYWIKHSQIIFNSGNGIFNCGTGGFLLDNFITANLGKGYCNDETSLHINITAIGNRIEWNRGGGMYLTNALTGTLSNNIFDRSGGTALYLGGDRGAVGININNNIFFRSSKPSYGYDSPECDSHVFMDHAKGITFSGNSFMAGRDDIDGDLSPKYGMVLKDVSHAVISGNSLYYGAVEKNICLLQDKYEDVIMENNCDECAPADLSWW